MPTHKKDALHPLLIRWTHWVNFPVLTVMIWSGALIYWANKTYWPVLPDRIYEILRLDHRLAEGMSYHFFFMWIFAINGILYFLYLIYSGAWRDLIPKKNSRNDDKFNRAQRIAYSAIVVMGFIAILSGLAIYKPIQLSGLKNFLGGYELARHIHFYLTIGFVLFFIIHVVQVTRAGWRKFCLMVGEKKALAGLAMWLILFVAGFQWMINQPQIDMLPGPLRHALELNEKLWVKFLDPNKLDSFKTSTLPAGKAPRFNGNIGLESNIDVNNWKITVSTPMTTHAPQERTISLDEIRKLPQTQILNEFKCIEGWSEIQSFSGVKFTDFLNAYHLGTHSGKPVDFKNHPEDLFSYVGLETPDGEYYVSIDMVSMLSPQTLLAFEQNGLPLTLRNGAPIRLAIPNKYGVKNIKRIGKITFADAKLPDYWGEEGYDWFIGL